MRQLTFVEPGKLEWDDVLEPRLRGDGEALVRPIASTPCDIDHLTIHGHGPFRGRHAIGHQCVAEVLDIGPGVRDVGPGQVVAVPWHINCGRCDRCRAGLTAYCRAVPPGSSYGIPGHTDWGGLFDEVVRVPYADAMLTVLPAGVAPAAAAEASDDLTIPIEFLAGHLQRQPAARVLVLGGGGSIALHGVAVARAMGTWRILYLDTDQHRRDLAQRLGAEVDTGPIRAELGEFDVVFDASVDKDLVVASLKVLAPHGAIESAGLPFGDIPLPGMRSYVQGLSFHTGLGNAGPHIRTALDLIQSGRLDPTVVLTETLPMNDADTALIEPSMKPLFVRDPVK